MWWFWAMLAFGVVLIGCGVWRIFDYNLERWILHDPVGDLIGPALVIQGGVMAAGAIAIMVF